MVVRRGLVKNWTWFALVLVAVTLVLFFATVPYAEAQSSARLTLLQSDASRIVLELEVSGYDSRNITVNGAPYSVFTIGDLGHTDEPGKPQLLVKGTMVGIPPGAQATLKILDDQSQTVAVPRHPLPAPTTRVQRDPSRPLADTTSESYTANPTTYSTNQFYPTAFAVIGATGDWRSQHYATVQFYPLQYNPVTRQLVLHRLVRVEITLTYPRGQSPQSLGASLNEGAFEPALQSAIINYSTAKNWRSKPAAAATTRAPRTASACPNATGPCYKIGVDADGIYKVACNQLPGATIPITPTLLQMFKNGSELAIKVAGSWGSSCTSSDYVLFFGQAPNSKYTTTNIYWLTYNVNTGARMATRNGTPGIGTAATSYTRTVHLEQNYIYRGESPRVEGFEHWYWQYILRGNAASYSFQLDHFASSSYSYTLKYDFVGSESPSATGVVNHHTIVGINGCSSADDATWSGYTERQITLTIQQACLISGTNALTVTEPFDIGNSNDIIYTNYFDVSYPSTFDAISDTLRFKQTISDTWQYELDSFSSAPIDLYDITSPSNVTQIISGTQSGGPPYSLQFSDPAPLNREYLALAQAQYKSPTSVVRDTLSNLRSPSNGADYIVISYGAFITNVQPLVTARNSQFSRAVQVVDVQDVYDEFSDGLIDPQAIHDFLSYAHSSWTAPAPSYVLLVGAGNFDPKVYCPSASNSCLQVLTSPGTTLIPPYLRMVDPFDGETVTDNCLVVFSGTCSLASHPLPEMFIGRLPADTTSDVSALVTKIVNYENAPSGTWRYTTAFVTDNAYDASGNLDDGGDFFFFSENIAGNPNYWLSGFGKDRIYYNPCTDTVTYPQCYLPFPSYSASTDAHDAIIASINNGRLIVNYIGHGAIQYWAQEPLFSFFNGDIASLANGSKTPVMLELTCRTGYFIYPHPSAPSLAKLNVNVSGNGAVASWAATGQGLAANHDFLEKGFFSAILNPGTRRLGPAISAGKAYLLSSGADTDLIDTTLLLGDPASKLALRYPYNYLLPFISK